MKKHTLSILFVIILLLAACQPATRTASPTTEPPTFTPTITPIPSFTPTSTITPTPTAAPGGFPRRFHVEGNAFVDQFGQKMVFRGLNSMDPVLMSISGDPRMPAFNENYFHVMASWGANILRVLIVPVSLHNYGLGQTLEALDQTIAWAGENHMYVIIDFHAIGWIPENWYPNHGDGNDTTLEEWTGFWKAISSRYADNDVVAFYELFNEPALNWVTHPYPYPSSDWLTWKGLVDTLINDTIRPNDPDKIILVDGLLSGYDLSYVAGAPIADISNNVAYAEQPYPSWISVFHLGWDSAFGNLSSQYPVFATEYAYDSSTDPLIDGIPYHKAIIDYLEAHSISWTVSNFSANWAPSLLLDNQTFEPSESGAYFRSRLLEINFPGVPTPTLLPPKPTPTGKPGNLAYNKPVTASSIEGPDLPAENAVDGDPSTRWSSAWSDPQWIQVDLGAVYHVNRVVLDWQAAYGVAYKIQISSDGSNWETIYSTTNGIGGIEDLSVSGSGRYVRMHGTSRHVINGASYGYSLYEFEVYGIP